MNARLELESKPPQRRLLIIGVDAGSPALFRRWQASGDLPNVSALVDSGQIRRVQNPYGLEAGSVWPVFHSGRLPGNQPQYDGRRWFSAEDYSVRWYGPEETPATFWRRLSDQGLSCLLIDPPYAHLDPAVNGAMIVDWGTHVPADGRAFAFRTHPAELGDEVLELVGPDPAEGVICDRRSPQTIDEHREFRDIHLRRIEAKGRLAAHLLATRAWDLAVVVSSDLHCAGHHLWHVADSRHPRYSPKLAAALGDPLRDCYRAFDDSLGAMLAAVGPDTTVLLFGSHGMGPAYSGTGLLDRILLRLDEHLGGRDGDAAVQASEQESGAVKGALRRAWHALPAELRGRLKPLRRRFGSAFRPPRLLDEQSGRRFFEVYANNANGGIRLNLKGREGQGTVEPEEADALIRYLVDELRKVRNADSGEPLVEDIVTTREQFSGRYLSRLPDLLVRWNRSAPIAQVESPAIGSLRHEFADNRSGDHTPDGFCVVRGPGVPAGSRGDAVCSADFAATAAAFFDGDIGHTDGRAFSIGQRTEAA